jgi:hypothetical protein
METAGSFDMLVTLDQNTRSHVPEDSDILLYVASLPPV